MPQIGKRSSGVLVQILRVTSVPEKGIVKSILVTRSLVASPQTFGLMECMPALNLLPRLTISLSLIETWIISDTLETHLSIRQRSNDTVSELTYYQLKVNVFTNAGKFVLYPPTNDFEPQMETPSPQYDARFQEDRTLLSNVSALNSEVINRTQQRDSPMSKLDVNKRIRIADLFILICSSF